MASSEDPCDEVREAGEELDLGGFEGDSIEAKLAFAAEVVKRLEGELSRVRSELRKSELTVKKLQEANAATALNHNNTSSAFALPSEFKKSWEELVQENLLDVFSGFLDDHFYFVKLVQDLLQEALGSLDESVEAKVKAICEVLGLPLDLAGVVKKPLLKILQDYSTSIFPLTDEFALEIKTRYVKKVESYLPDEMAEDVRQALESDDFRQMLEALHKIGLHMTLNDPQLKLPFSEALEYQKFEKAEDFYCIDGFPKGQPPCVVVLPPVMRDKFPYQGIRPAVLVLKFDTELISADRQRALTCVEKTPKTPEQPLEQITKTCLDIESEEKLPDQTPNKEAHGSVSKMYAYKLNRSRSPLTRNRSKDISPRQVAEIYNRYKDKLQKLKQTRSVTPVDNEDENACSMPFQKEERPDKRLLSQADLGQSERTPLRAREAESIPISTATLKALIKKREEQSNPLHKYRAATIQGNKASLLSLANRIPAETTKPKSSRTLNSIETDRSKATMINKRLSEAASRLDRRAWARNHIGKDKETCKVM